MLDQADVTEFKPTKRAIWLYHLILSAVSAPLVFGMFISVFQLTIEKGVSQTVIATLGYMFTATFLLPGLQKYLTIRISSDEITGPAEKLFLQSTTFALVRLDKSRTTRPSIFQRLQACRYIWSVDNQRILVNLLYFSKAQRQAVFEKIGCAEALTTSRRPNPTD